MKSSHRQPSRRLERSSSKRQRLAFAIGALALGSPILVSALSFQATSAAYVDNGRTTLGSSGSVGANTFQVQIRDAAGSWVTAADPSKPQIIPASINSIGTFNDTPSATSIVSFRIAPQSPSGNVIPTLVASAACAADCQSVFPYLRFSLFYDNAPATLSRLTLEEFNSKPLRLISGLNAGVEHSLTIGVELLPSTPFRHNAKSVNFGIQLDAASVPIP
ncbi:hypothetical protein [Lysinibacter cavernae]|uniref:Uncharacterized protein n=1 Tax=Lysinibacter cavernae TaxID=1640652 RepID=A0A7X5R3N0_9MICO|nr:hypothetical protein [Lysinibacter cavernae]NIH54971.1 hypothetical protein [Lysinibacter cavernae]